MVSMEEALKCMEERAKKKKKVKPKSASTNSSLSSSFECGEKKRELELGLS